MHTHKHKAILSFVVLLSLLPFMGGCGGSQAANIAPTSPSNPSQPTQPTQPTPTVDNDFSLSASASSTSLTLGGTAGALVNLTVTDASAEGDTVTIAAPTLPAGVSIDEKQGGGNIFPLTIPGEKVQTVTFGASPVAVAGTYPIVFLASDTDGHSHSVTISLIINPAVVTPPPPVVTPLPSLIGVPSSITLISNGPNYTVTLAQAGTQTVQVSIVLPPSVFFQSGPDTCPSFYTCGPLTLVPNVPQSFQINAIDDLLTANSNLLLGNLQLIESGNGPQQNILIPVTVIAANAIPPSEYTLAVNPLSIPLSQTNTFAVTATSSGPFNQDIYLTFAGLPIGVSVNSTSMVNGNFSVGVGGPSTFTLTDSGAAAGTYLVTVNGTAVTAGVANGYQQSTVFSLVVAASTAPAPVPTPSFSLQALTSGAPYTPYASIQAGGTGVSISLIVLSSNGYSDTTNISISQAGGRAGLPAGVTASPASFQSIGVNSATVLMLTADSTALPGATQLIFTGVDPITGLTETVPFELDVTAPPETVAPPVLSGVPSSIILTAGSEQAYGFSVSLTSADQAVMTVTYPTGVTGSGAGPFPMLTGTSQQISVQALTCDAPCSSGGNIIITVAVGAVQQVYNIPVTVVSDGIPPTFTLQLSASTITLITGQSTSGKNISVGIIPVSGYSYPVTVTFSGASIQGFTMPVAALGSWQNVSLPTFIYSQTTVVTVTATGSDGTTQSLQFSIVEQN